MKTLILTIVLLATGCASAPPDANSAHRAAFIKGCQGELWNQTTGHNRTVVDTRAYQRRCINDANKRYPKI